MMVFDELGYLENHFIEEQKKGRKMADLYESVQHAGNIIPRLYLLITVGSAYVKTREAPVKLILRDLLDMVKGVQQPVRGLFLRYYLLKMMKDKLPDKGSPYEGDGGDVNDAIDFILQNMSEMNRLWVRLQHLSSAKDKEQREVERNELRVTVGENIIRLGHLEGMTYDIYKSVVLPKILEIVVICKDTMAQQYLMDCIIQVFPDEYHLQSLEQLLDTTSNLNPSVDIKSIFINLMEKLSKFAAANADSADVAAINKDLDIFKLFKKYTDKIIEEQGKTIEVARLLELEVAFMNFSIKTYPKNIAYVNQILESCVQILRSTPIHNSDNNSMKLLVKLLSIPLESLSIAVLNMNHYPTLMKYMKFSNRRTVALRIVKAVLGDKQPLDKPKTVDQLIDFIMPLLQDDKDSGEEEPYEFEEGQEAVAKLVHLVCHKSNIDLYYEILMKFKRVFVKGGIKRMKYSMPALIFSLFRLSQELVSRPEQPQMQQEEETKGDEEDELQIKLPKVDQIKLFKCVGEILNQLKSQYPELALRLYLQTAEAINRIPNFSDLEEEAYDFCTNALEIYEQELSDSESKFAAINLIVSAMFNLQCFGPDNYDTLVTNTVGYCSKLLKKPSQCEAIIFASSLYYSSQKKQGNKVMDCLKRALKIADAC